METANLQPSWEQFLKNDWPALKEFLAGSWIIPTLTMLFGTGNLIFVYMRTNGFNSIAVSISALKEIVKDIEFSEDFSLYTIFDWIISVT